MMFLNIQVIRYKVKLFNLPILFILFSCIPPSDSNKVYDRHIITKEEIRSVPQAENAMEVIEYLRPHLLSRDGRRYVGITSLSTGQNAIVFVNGTRIGFKERLNTINSMNIVEIRYLSPMDAGKYGYSSGGGVFLIEVE